MEESSEEKLSRVHSRLDGVKRVRKYSEENCRPSTSCGPQANDPPRNNERQPQSYERQKIKQKINNVKQKFARFNKRINGAGIIADSTQDGGREALRTRSNSERSSGVSEQSGITAVQRSKSVTMSTMSLASEGICEDANEVDNGDPKKSKRKRRRNRGESRNERIVEDVYQLEIGGEMKLNAETLLILDLLSLPEGEREEFLINRAKDRMILIENQESHKLQVNPKIANLQSILCKGKTVWELNDSVRHRVQEVANSRSPKPQPPKRDRPIFEQLVNAVVAEGLNEEQKEQFTFAGLPKRQRTKNYFFSYNFTSSLEAFAQKCVEANLGVIIEGEIRVNAKNNDQAFMKHVQDEKDAMFASQLIRKCALHGDIVRAFIRIPTNDTSKDTSIDGIAIPDCGADEDDEEPLDVAPERSAKGFVIKIVEEVHNRRCVGSFLSYRLDSEYITFVPRDMKMPNMRIYREHWPESFATGKIDKIQDVLYMAEITDWSGDICIGKILQAVGKCGELESENTAILLQNNLLVIPYEDKFNEMFYGPIVIPDEERRKRVDLTGECIFTIDPLTARDLDDAMSCKSLPNGNYEIGVHISDVAHYLPEDSQLDQIVKKRTTSIYMVNEVFHMLPKPLCMKCSLLPGDEKFAFSVMWEITPKAEIVNTRFFRCIMNSCTQLAYEHAQKIIDFPDKEFTENDFPTIYNGYTASDIVEKVKVMHSLATILREKRFDNGAIRMNRPKLFFELAPDSGAPISYGACQLSTANYLIEEFMLLANQSVARFTYDSFPEIAILRHHDPPVSNAVKKVKEQLTALGMDIDISSSKSLYDSLLRLVDESEDKDITELCLSHVLSKPMNRAKYFCSGSKTSEKEFWHYALSIPIYTHFTSPIRRYPDVLVHRVLSAALDYTPPPKRTLKELQDIAAVCNEHKFNAKKAGEDSLNLYFMHYIKSKKFLTVRAAVLDMWLHAMEVILIETGHLVRVSYPKEGKGNAKIILNNKARPYTAQLIFPNAPNEKPKELKMFSEILVEIFVEKNKLRARIAAPSTPSSENAPKEASNSLHADANLSATEIEESTQSCPVTESCELEEDISPTTSTVCYEQTNAPGESCASLTGKEGYSQEDASQYSPKIVETNKDLTEKPKTTPSTSGMVLTNDPSAPATKPTTETTSRDTQDPEEVARSEKSSSENALELGLESKTKQRRLRRNSEEEGFSFEVITELDFIATQCFESKLNSVMEMPSKDSEGEINLIKDARTPDSESKSHPTNEPESIYSPELRDDDFVELEETPLAADQNAEARKRAESQSQLLHANLDVSLSNESLEYVTPPMSPTI